MNFWQDMKEQERYSQIDGTLTSGVQICLSLRESKSGMDKCGSGEHRSQEMTTEN